MILDISSQLNVKEEVLNIAVNNHEEINLKKSRVISKHSTSDKKVNDTIKMEIGVDNLDRPKEFEYKFSLRKLLSSMNKDKKKSTSVSEFSVPENHDLSKFLVHHENMNKVIWDILVLVIVIYTVIFTPIYLCFYQKIFIFKLIECLIELIFLFDLFLNFITTYNDNEENLVSHLSQISENYISSWFFYDLIASFPIEFFSFIFKMDTPFSKDKFSLSLEVFKWIKVLQVVKIFRENSAGRLIQKVFFIKNNKQTRIIKFGLLFFILTHLCSCFFIYLGLSSLTQNNWITNIGFGLDNFEIYLTSLYYNLVTIYSIGYGDITPVNIVEKCWVIIFMIAGSMLYSYAISSISTIFLEKNIRFMEYKQKITVLESICLEYEIPAKLLQKISKTIKFQYNKNENERYELLDSLPTKMKNDLMIIIYGEMICQQNFFKKQNLDFLLYVLPMLRFHRVEKGETLISVGDIVEEMYFVIKGSLSLTLGVHSNNLQVWKIRKGNHFGDLLMQLNENSPFELKCKKKSTDVLVLKKEDFLKIKNSFTNNIFEILENSLNQLKWVDKKFQLFHILLNQYKDPSLANKKMIQLNNFLFEIGLDEYLDDYKDFEEPIEFIKSKGIKNVIEILDIFDKKENIEIRKSKATRIKNNQEKIENEHTNMKITDVLPTKERFDFEVVKKENQIKFLNSEKIEEKRPQESETLNNFSTQLLKKKKSKKIKESYKTAMFLINKNFKTRNSSFKLNMDKEFSMKSSNLFEINEEQGQNRHSRTQKFLSINGFSQNKCKSNVFSHSKNKKGKSNVYSESVNHKGKSNVFSQSMNRNMNTNTNIDRTIYFPFQFAIQRTVNIHIMNDSYPIIKLRRFRNLVPISVKSFMILPHYETNTLLDLKSIKTYQTNEQKRNKEFLDQIEKFKDHYSIQNSSDNEKQFLFLESYKDQGVKYINNVMSRFEMKLENEVLTKLEKVISTIKKYRRSPQNIRITSFSDKLLDFYDFNR